MNLTTDKLQGHAGWRWSLPQGDSVFVAQQGAQVLSWQTGGQERLYLSPVSACDGTTAIRGGIPVCFPQFNQRGTLPKHGFARNMAWRLVAEQSQGSEKVFELSDNAQTRALWPIQFKTQLKVLLSAQALKIQLSVQNLGLQTLSFTGALHTYFAVNQIQQVSLQGQAHQAEWDAVNDTHQKCQGQLSFNTEFDRVYDVATENQPTWTLTEGADALHISQSASWGQSVVWNPGAEKCSQLKDMPVDGYQRMLCVEAARVTSSIEVPPSQQWEAWQQLTVSTSC
jgi:glucose-6-phosphate 1-epimerase